MKPSNTGAVMALSLLSISIGPTMAQKEYQGCYKSVGSLEAADPWTWQTSDWCLGTCANETSPGPVLAVQFKSCFCGDELPADSEKTSDSDCTRVCPGWQDEHCGGSDTYSIYINTNIQDAADVPKAGASSSSSSSSGTAPTSTGPAQQTVVQTAQSDANKDEGGPNKAAIAAGVVVGVVAVAAIIGGAFFFMKYKKRKAIEEEYHQNAAVSNFIAGGKPGYTPSSESRFDSSLMSQRRQSNGSIADDQDFSRRILKVTNPDGY